METRPCPCAVIEALGSLAWVEWRDWWSVRHAATQTSAAPNVHAKDHLPVPIHPHPRICDTRCAFWPLTYSFRLNQRSLCPDGLDPDVESGHSDAGLSPCCIHELTRVVCFERFIEPVQTLLIVLTDESTVPLLVCGSWAALGAESIADVTRLSCFGIRHSACVRHRSCKHKTAATRAAIHTHAH